MPAKRKKAAAGGTLGARIRRFRLAKGLTQADLGRLIGVSQRNVAYYEVKGVSPPPELLVRIADALDVSTDVLLGRKKGHEQAGEPRLAELRRLRRLKRLEELPRHERIVLFTIIDALADRSARRKGG